MTPRALTAGLVLLAAASSALAATNMPRVDSRQAGQEQRIQQGVSSGQLTEAQARQLQAQQGRFTAAEARAKADGQVTAQERRQLGQMQERASRNIRHQKHDAQRQPQAATRPSGG